MTGAESSREDRLCFLKRRDHMGSSDDLLISEQMIAHAIDYHPISGEPVIRYDKLTPEHALMLMVYPMFATLDLASTIDRERAATLQERGAKSDVDEDYLTLADVCSQLLDQVKFLTYPLSPPVHGNLFEELFIGMGNYIILSKALVQYLRDRDPFQIVEWEDRLALDEIRSTLRFPYAVNLIWLGSMLGIASVQVNGRSQEKRVEATKEDDLALPVVAVSLNDDQVNEGVRSVPDCHMVGIHPKDQEDYELWVMFFLDDSIDFMFRPLWSIDEFDFAEKMTAMILRSELQVRELVRRLQESWDVLAEKIDDFAIDHTDHICAWMDRLIGSENLVQTSFDYGPLRKSLMTLHFHARTSKEMESVCQEYLKLHRQHIPFRLRERLKRAVIEIDEIMSVIRPAAKDHKENTAIGHMKRNPDRFQVITEGQVRHALKLFVGTGKSQARNIRESILEGVARAYKSDASKTTIIRSALKSL